MGRWHDGKGGLAHSEESARTIGVAKLAPHDLRRTFCSRVTALEFGREAMNRVTNHKEGGIADV